MKRIFVTLVCLAVLGVIGRQVYVKINEPEQAGRRGGPSAVAIAAEPVATATVRDVAEFTGTLLPKSHFTIAPKVSGRLEELMVNIGDTVTSGQLIAVLDSDEYVEQVAQARAELEVSKANRIDYSSGKDIAEREFKRVAELWEQKVASTADYEQAQARLNAAAAKLQVAEAQIKQREAALKAAELRLSYTRIRAEWDPPEGERLIAQRFVDEGALLRANDPIVSVVDTSSVIGVIYVIERDFPQIRIGQPAEVTLDAYPDRAFDGTIVRFAPVLREESRQARVEIEVPNPEGLLAPGMFTRTRIQFAEHEDVTVVPNSAIVRRNGSRGVFLVETESGPQGPVDKARFVALETGIVDGNVTEVVGPEISGLVVTLGHHLLEDGATVVMAEDGEPADAEGPRAGAPEERP